MAVVLGIVALILVGGWLATRAVYFVGTDPRDDRTIAIFRGLPYDLPLGVELYQRYAGSGVTIDDVPPLRPPRPAAVPSPTSSTSTPASTGRRSTRASSLVTVLPATPR